MVGLRRAVELLGGQSALAGAIGVKQQHVWNWLNRPNSEIAAESCVAIERATGGSVRRWDLRPEDWHRIWPELIGTKGSPKLPAKEGA